VSVKIDGLIFSETACAIIYKTLSFTIYIKLSKIRGPRLSKFNRGLHGMAHIILSKIWWPRLSRFLTNPSWLTWDGSYIVKRSVLWIMAQAVSKNIEPSIFQVTHTKCLISGYLPKVGTTSTLSREKLIWRIWNFLHIYFLVSYSLAKIFSTPHWAVRFLWISKYKQKSTFSTTCEIYNFLLEWGKHLKSSLQIEYSLSYLP